MFAVQLQNLDTLEQILLDVSDPASANYGLYMTKNEVTDLTSNPDANIFIKNHLKESGADIVYETHGGEYISATGKISLWEEMFNTEFYVFHHTRKMPTTSSSSSSASSTNEYSDSFINRESRSSPTSNSAASEEDEHEVINKVLRAEKYSIPVILNNHVTAVFYTIQMPMAIKSGSFMIPFPQKISPELTPETPKMTPVMTPIADIPIMRPKNDDTVDIIYVTGDEENDQENDQNKTNSSPIHMNAGTSTYITPTLLRSFYKLGNAMGSALSTQSVYETLTQYYSPSDLLKFQNLFNLYTDSTVINIGNHASDQQCTTNKGANCIEGNLDIQYMMGIAQISPTTFWWIDPSNSFGQWLQQVSNMQSPPLVFSISYSVDEGSLSGSEVNLFTNLAISLGVRGEENYYELFNFFFVCCPCTFTDRLLHVVF